VELRHLKKFAQVCADMGVEAPFTVSMKLGDIGNLFRRIVDAAQ
jgi:Ras family protein T1